MKRSRTAMIVRERELLTKCTNCEESTEYSGSESSDRNANRRNVKSKASETVDGRNKDFLTESEMRRLLDAARTGRHGVRDFAMMLLVTLAALLGHSRLTMVMRYAHPSQEHQFEAMKKVAAYRARKVVQR